MSKASVSELPSSPSSLGSPEVTSAQDPSIADTTAVPDEEGPSHQDEPTPVPDLSKAEVEQKVFQRMEEVLARDGVACLPTKPLELLDYFKRAWNQARSGTTLGLQGPVVKLELPDETGHSSDTQEPDFVPAPPEGPSEVPDAEVPITSNEPGISFDTQEADFVPVHTEDPIVERDVSLSSMSEQDCTTLPLSSSSTQSSLQLLPDIPRASVDGVILVQDEYGTTDSSPPTPPHTSSSPSSASPRLQYSTPLAPYISLAAVSLPLVPYSESCTSSPSPSSSSSASTAPCQRAATARPASPNFLDSLRSPVPVALPSTNEPGKMSFHVLYGDLPTLQAHLWKN